jgi:mannosylglycoprotein endo-beta-mannosidase
VEVREILSDAQGKLAEIFQATVARNRHLTSANWLRYGDICSKTFFDFHRIGKKKTLMKKLGSNSGTITGQIDLTHHVTNFYSRLYTSEASNASTAEAQELCWQSVPIKVSEDMNASLTSRLSLEEVCNAIRALPKGKAPGHDDIPMEFFHEYEQEVAPDLLQAFTAMLNEGATLPFINKGIITLILKSGDRARFNNWKSITLFGSVYKILAKVLAGRLEAAFPNIIRPNQTGFVEGRSILDNVFMA